MRLDVQKTYERVSSLLYFSSGSFGSKKLNQILHQGRAPTQSLPIENNINLQLGTEPLATIRTHHLNNDFGPLRRNRIPSPIIKLSVSILDGRLSLVSFFRAERSGLKSRLARAAQVRWKADRVVRVLRTRPQRRGPILHLVSFAEGRVFEHSAQKLRTSLPVLSSFPVEAHIFNRRTISDFPWFARISGFPSRKAALGLSGEPFNYARKPFLVREILQSVAPGDVVYWVDSSRHFPIGFYKSVDLVVDAVIGSPKLLFAGSTNLLLRTADVRWPEDNRRYVCAKLGIQQQVHVEPFVLASSFMFEKTDWSEAFVGRWARAVDFESTKVWGDQGILSAMVNTTGDVGTFALEATYRDLTQARIGGHSIGKNPNTVHVEAHRARKLGKDITSLFTNPRDIR